MLLIALFCFSTFLHAQPPLTTAAEALHNLHDSIPSKSPSIQSIKSFIETQNVFDTADNTTLILFDIDDTLLKSPSKEELHDGIKLQAHIPVLTEPDIVNIFKKLHAQNGMVLALSTFPTGSFGPITSLPKWRLEKLKSVGLTFSKTKPTAKTFLNLVEGKQPKLYEGMLLTDGVEKYRVLEAFLDTVKPKISRIISFDDTLKNLEEERDAMAKRNIPFVGYEYAPSDK